jgi:Ca-activated chloride channel family protein
MHLRSSRKAWFDPRLCVALSIALLFAASAAALAQVDVSNWPQVHIELLALSSQGDLISGLAQNDLLLREDGKTQPVVAVKPAAEPQSVCLMLDSSGSMYDRRQGLVDAATRLLKALPPEDEVCVADFSFKLYIDQDLTRDRQSDIKALSYIKSSGATALRSSLVAMADYMHGAAKFPSRAIILLSDGVDDASTIGDEQMKRQMESNGGPVVHVICLPLDPGKHQFDTAPRTDQKAALHLTALFGGLTYFPRDAADLDQSVDHLVDAMKSRYILTWQTQDTARDGRPRRIAIEFDKLHQKTKAVVRAPQEYYAPS